MRSVAHLLTYLYVVLADLLTYLYVVLADLLIYLHVVWESCGTLKIQEAVVVVPGNVN